MMFKQSQKYISIANQQQVVEVVNSFKRRSEETKVRVAPVLKSLWNTERLHQSITKPINFDVLKKAHPHFEDVINHFKRQAIASFKLNQPFRSAPVLLLGAAGLGKSHFASGMGTILNLDYFEISLSTATASFALSGSSLQWGEGRPGYILESIAKSKVANPLIMIDELDKVTVGTKYDPMGPFYQLLEPHSAARFRDEALDIQIDASHVIWIATANYKDQIPRPILSRFKCFNIKQPTPEEMLGVIDSIYEMLLSNEVYKDLLDPELGNNVKDLLVYQSPRMVRMILDDAISSAICNDRVRIEPADLDIGKDDGYHVGFF